MGGQLSDRSPAARLPFAYTPEELRAIHEFHAPWDEVADALLPDYGSLAQVQGRSGWEQLRRVAEATLAVFSQRGRLSEDTEVE